MSVLDGPRVEKRRILLDGIATWVTVADDGRLQRGGRGVELQGHRQTGRD